MRKDADPPGLARAGLNVVAPSNEYLHLHCEFSAGERRILSEPLDGLLVG
jgi:hypothetical protein